MAEYLAHSRQDLLQYTANEEGFTKSGLKSCYNGRNWLQVNPSRQSYDNSSQRGGVTTDGQ